MTTQAKSNLLHFLLLGFVALSVHCRSKREQNFTPREVHSTSTLQITQLTPHTYQHISFLQTNDFGMVPCNGLVVRQGKEAIVFDTPTNDSASEELIQWIKRTLGCQIRAIIPTHFHNDCLGGLKVFEQKGIPSYAGMKTIELAALNNYPVPQNGFSDSLWMKLGGEKLLVRYFGEGHTRDNVVGYFPKDQVLFGGCLVKELDASKGYLGDANKAEWPRTVERVKRAFPELKIVVPGHGEAGGVELLDYTIQLFK